jgi:valyl-tRNA synthetase
VKAPEAEGEVLVSMTDDIRALAGIGGFEVGEDVVRPPHASSAVAAGSEVYVSLEGLVDFAAERERIASQLERAQNDLDRLTRKLGNEGFLAKAAPDIIEKDRARSGELAATVSKLSAQLADLAE